MLLEKQKNEMKRHEAWRVYGALLVCNHKPVLFMFFSLFFFFFGFLFSPILFYTPSTPVPSHYNDAQVPPLQDQGRDLSDFFLVNLLD